MQQEILIFLEVYKDLHNSGYKEEDPLRSFLFSTKQHAILVFYISSLSNKKSTLEDICYNISRRRWDGVMILIAQKIIIN